MYTPKLSEPFPNYKFWTFISYPGGLFGKYATLAILLPIKQFKAMIYNLIYEVYKHAFYLED